MTCPKKTVRLPFWFDQYWPSDNSIFLVRRIISQDVSRFLNCCRPNCNVTVSILEPSYVVLSCLYQFEDLVLKSPRTTVRNGFWLLILSNESCKLSANSSKESEDWLGDRYKEIKLHDFPLNKISKINHSCRQWTSINLKASKLL